MLQVRRPALNIVGQLADDFITPVFELLLCVRGQRPDLRVCRANQSHRMILVKLQAEFAEHLTVLPTEEDLRLARVVIAAELTPLVRTTHILRVFHPLEGSDQLLSKKVGRAAVRTNDRQHVLWRVVHEPSLITALEADLMAALG